MVAKENTPYPSTPPVAAHPPSGTLCPTGRPRPRNFNRQVADIACRQKRKRTDFSSARGRLS